MSHYFVIKVYYKHGEHEMAGPLSPEELVLMAKEDIEDLCSIDVQPIRDILKIEPVNVTELCKAMMLLGDEIIRGDAGYGWAHVIRGGDAIKVKLQWMD